MPKRGLGNNGTINTPTVSCLPNIAVAAQRVGVLGQRGWKESSVQAGS